jgi:hypothetical protein
MFRSNDSFIRKIFILWYRLPYMHRFSLNLGLCSKYNRQFVYVVLAQFSHLNDDTASGSLDKKRQKMPSFMYDKRCTVLPPFSLQTRQRYWNGGTLMASAPFWSCESDISIIAVSYSIKYFPIRRKRQKCIFCRKKVNSGPEWWTFPNVDGFLCLISLLLFTVLLYMYE